MLQARQLLRGSHVNLIASRRLGHKLVLQAHGKLQDVVKLQKQERPRLQSDNSVLIGVLATNINPADINVIEGHYPIKPKLPGVFGYDGVAQVLEVGRNVKQFKAGDRVWPNSMRLGMFQTYIECTPQEIVKVDPRLSVMQAATLLGNPASAYKMIKMGALQKGDTIIQNAANSAVGQCVIQIARAWSLNTVNVVRPRADIAQMRKLLTDMGGSVVITEDELRDDAAVKALLSRLKRPKLALNAVGGKQTIRLAMLLDQGALCVTYGGMSGQAVMVPAQSFIFQDLRFAGFWLGNWREQATKTEAGTAQWLGILKDLTDLALAGSLKPPVCELRPATEWRTAFDISCSGGKGTNTADPSAIQHRPKQLLTFYDPQTNK